MYYNCVIVVVAMAESSKDPDMWARELALREREIQLREAEMRLRAEEKKKEEERRLQELQLRAEEKQREQEAKQREEERWRIEMQFREQELEMQKRAQEARIAEDKSLIGRTRKYAEVIKNVFPPMPKESAELPAFFDSVENIFSLYQVPADLRSKLLVARLIGKAKTVAHKLSVSELDDYSRVKQSMYSK